MTTTRLPIHGSTAKSTAFVHHRLTDPDEAEPSWWLYLDGNGKITSGNGTLDQPAPNALSLVEVVDCPQSTHTCRAACYVQNLKQAQPVLYGMYQHNSVTLRNALNDQPLANRIAMVLANWITHNARGGFRWHVSGDVFSHSYARFIADVCRESPTVNHWIYTRSFKFLPILRDVSTDRGGNLAINLSCDRDNYLAARSAGGYHAKDPDKPLRLAYLVTAAEGDKPPTDLPPGSIVFPDYALRPRQYATLAESPWWQELPPEQRKMVCPVDGHGKSESRRCGPCDKCLT